MTRIFLIALMAVALACTSAGVPPEGAVSAVIGAAGGQIDGPAGAAVTIPPGALAADTTITITPAAAGFSPLPALAGSGVFAFEPHGQRFEVPVTIRLPHAFGPGQAAMWTSEPGGAWTRLAAADRGGFTEVEVTHFSYFFNGREVCGLYRQACCEADSADGRCAGDALACKGGICLECGLGGDRCCPGSVCRDAPISCAEYCGGTGSGAGRCNAENTCMYDCDCGSAGGGGSGGTGGGDGGS